MPHRWRAKDGNVGREDVCHRARLCVCVCVCLQENTRPAKEFSVKVVFLASPKYYRYDLALVRSRIRDSKLKTAKKSDSHPNPVFPMPPPAPHVNLISVRSRDRRSDPHREQAKNPRQELRANKKDVSRTEKVESTFPCGKQKTQATTSPPADDATKHPTLLAQSTLAMIPCMNRPTKPPNMQPQF